MKGKTVLKPKNKKNPKQNEQIITNVKSVLQQIYNDIFNTLENEDDEE